MDTVMVQSCFCLQIFSPTPLSCTHTPTHTHTDPKSTEIQACAATVCICNKISHCAKKCFMAFQDETAPKVNRLALDKKFAGSSLLLTYDFFFHDSLMALFFTFLFVHFHTQNNMHKLLCLYKIFITSLCSWNLDVGHVFCSVPCTAPKNGMMFMRGQAKMLFYEVICTCLYTVSVT